MMTQTDLANKLGVTRSSVNAWEMGISVPTTDKIVEIALLYGAKKVAELLFVGDPSDKNAIVLVLFNKDNPVSMKRKDLFILARHVGDYVETIPGRFIEQ